MNAHTRRRRRSRQQQQGGKPIPRRPAPDILPSSQRPIVDRAILEHNRPATHCRHGVPWGTWCEKCERGEIKAAVDAQLRARWELPP